MPEDGVTLGTEAEPTGELWIVTPMVDERRALGHPNNYHKNKKGLLQRESLHNMYLYLLLY